MNNLIISVIAFSIGIVCGAIFFTCSSKAYDYDRRPTMDQMIQKDRLDQLEQNYNNQREEQHNEWLQRKPC